MPSYTGPSGALAADLDATSRSATLSAAFSPEPSLPALAYIAAEGTNKAELVRITAITGAGSTTLALVRDAGSEPWAPGGTGHGSGAAIICAAAQPAGAAAAELATFDPTASALSAGGTVVLDVLSGTADPSAGDGVAASLTALYRRTNGTTGELWFKTGAAATGWTKVV